jgi:N-methylhydantoinase B/oxoprolinase/acetone carboxylase alpha subunit
MFITLRRTAMSSVIYENLDFGVAITDKQGGLAGQGAELPGFIGMLDSGVKKAIEKHGRAQSMRQGDIFLTNDPYGGGVSHLNDVVIALPVFDEGDIVAGMVNKAHWTDIGGMNPGSLSTPSTAENRNFSISRDDLCVSGHRDDRPFSPEKARFLGERSGMFAVPDRVAERLGFEPT